MISKGRLRLNLSYVDHSGQSIVLFFSAGDFHSLQKNVSHPPKHVDFRIRPLFFHLRMYNDLQLSSARLEQRKICEWMTDDLMTVNRLGFLTVPEP